MSLLTVESPVVCSRVEFAFGADRNAPAESWEWSEMGDYTAEGRTRPRLVNQTLEISAGRSDESNLADSSQIDVLLGNADGALTPRNPSSIYYPGVVRGTPCRISVQAGLPHLLLHGTDGSRARTPDAAALDITSDLAGIVEFLSPVHVPPQGTTYTIEGKYVASGNQRSWVLALSATGQMLLYWSADGTNVLGPKITAKPLPYPEAGPFSFGWEFDVSNAGNNVATWYVRRGTLAELRANLTDSIHGTDTDSGATSIFSSSAPFDVGDVEGVTNFAPYPGRINRVQVRAGNLTSGTIVANLDATALTPGATGTADSAGRVWTFNDAEVTNWRPRFCGRVVSSRADWTVVDEDNPLSPTIAHVKVQASGILERLNQADALESALTRFLSARVNSDDIVAVWPFEDGSDATQAAQLVSGAAPMSIRGTYDFGGDDDYPASLQQMTIGSGDNAYMSASIPHIPQNVGVNWQVTRFFRIDEPAVGPATTQLMAVDTNGRVATWRVTINDTQIAISGLDLDGVGVVLDTIPADTDWFNTEAMIVLEVTDDGANVDWAVSIIPIPLGSVFATSGTFVGNTGVPLRFRNSCTGPPSGISLGHLIVTQNKAIGWLAPADTAYAFEPAAQRVFRLCQEERLPIAVNGVYGTDWNGVVLDGGHEMGPQRPLKLLDLLDECAEVDRGILSEQRGTLGLIYRSGGSLLNQDARLTLRRAGRQIIEPFEPNDDDLRFVNDVTVKRPDGSSVHIEDPRIGDGEEERYEQTTTTNVASDFHLPTQAGWRYHLGTWSELRYPQIATDIAKTASLVEDALGLGIGDRFNVPDPPPGHPPDTIDQLVDGITEELERFQWRMTLNGHPARPWDVAILDDDDLGKLDTAGSELAAEFEVGTDTTMSVATTLGPLWTTSAGEFPFDVDVAGARVTVTAISGSVSPQTFTVTQAAVNGVAKVIPAGTSLRLWQAARISL